MYVDVLFVGCGVDCIGYLLFVGIEVFVFFVLFCWCFVVGFDKIVYFCGYVIGIGVWIFGIWFECVGDFGDDEVCFLVVEYFGIKVICGFLGVGFCFWLCFGCGGLCDLIGWCVGD